MIRHRMGLRQTGKRCMIACLTGLLLTGCTALAGCTGSPDGTGLAEKSGSILIKPSQSEESRTEENRAEETHTNNSTAQPQIQPTPAETAGPIADETAVVLSLRIVDGAETGNLLLAGESSSEIYALAVGDIPVFLDDAPASAADLQDGMTAEISYSGDVMETWPAQLCDVTKISVYSLGTEKNPGGTAYDLSGLYLQVLRDLWDTDPGLNDGITYISVDLSHAPGNLTEGEKSAIAWIFACEHNASMLTLSYRELVDQGYCEETNWEDGILFQIEDSTSDGGCPGRSSTQDCYPLPTIHFSAEKWRSGLGAYFFQDCQAVWPEFGTWSSYTVGAEAIS